MGPAEAIAFALGVALIAAGAFAGKGPSVAPGVAAAAGHPALASFFAAGAIVGAGSLLPGFSASFVLIWLGLYEPLLDALRELDVAAGLAAAIGALAALAALSRAVSALYRRFHGIVSFSVLGFTVGSLAIVFPGFPQGAKAVGYFALATAGFLSSFGLARVGD